MIRRLALAVISAARSEELRQSMCRLGRIDFLLRTVTLTGIAFALEYLGDTLLHLRQLSHFIYVTQWIIFFGIFGSVLLVSIDQRLNDAGLHRRYKYPLIIIWLTSVSVPVAWPSERQTAIVLFIFFSVIGCLFRSRPFPTELAPLGTPSDSGWSERTTRKDYRPTWHVAPVSFLRSLLTLACLWVPLIWLENISKGENGIWLARIGYCILGYAWLYILLGRLNDAGRLPRKRYGFLLVGIILFIEMFGHALGNAWSALSHDLFPFGATLFVDSLLQRVRHISAYEMLALFLLLQIPLAFFKSERAPRSAEYDQWAAGKQKQPSRVKVNVHALCGPTRYLRILALIDFLWFSLIYIDHVSAGGIGTWAARFGYVILIAFWMTFAHGRLVDAGMAHSEYPAQYFLVCSVVSLMPLAFRWVNGYGSLTVFCLMQTTLIFLHSKPLPHFESEG
jgi:hypothetical protein